MPPSTLRPKRRVHINRGSSLALAMLLVACSPRDTGQKDSSASSPAGDTAAAADSTPSGASTDPWVATESGLGAIRVGMTADELRTAGGAFDVRPGSASTCTYVRPGNVPTGVSVMLVDGRVARVDVDSAGVRTDAGVQVGDSASHVTTAYGDRVTTMPHKYEPGASYLTVRPVSPADTAHRLVFESSGGRVARYRVGRVPEVQWVEGCG